MSISLPVVLIKRPANSFLRILSHLRPHLFQRLPPLLDHLNPFCRGCIPGAYFIP